MANYSNTPPAPGISVAFKVLGILILFGSIAGFFLSVAAQEASSGIPIALGGAVSGLVFFAISFALKKLHQIERHFAAARDEISQPAQPSQPES